MQKYLSIVLPILFLWISSCDHEESSHSEVTDNKKIVLTDLNHEPVVKELLAKIQNPVANGRISTIEIADAFFKYEDSDSGILNYTLRLPDNSPDYFENLVLSQYEDGFYGFIYRYIPDDIYSDDGDFKGILQLYNLENELIQELRIPFEADSAYAGGRTQLVSPCIKGVEQNCVTTYEVKTVTDYPCHCQYESKTKVGKVCTVSLKKGWCDETVAAPPAGGGGTFVNVPGEEPHGGGGGGGGKTPPKKNPVVLLQDDGYDDITYDKVKSPCLVRVIKNLVRKDFKNKINHLAMTKFINTGVAVNLDFNEISSIKNEKGEISHAATSPVFTNDSEGNTHVTVNLNSSTLPGTSELFQIITVYHESIHGIFKVLNTGAYVTENGTSKFKYYREMTTTEQHEVIASTDVVGHIIDAIHDIYGRTLSQTEESDIAAIVLYGISDAGQTTNYKASLSKWDLDMKKVASTGELNEKAVYDSNNNLLTIGGKECNNE